MASQATRMWAGRLAGMQASGANRQAIKTVNQQEEQKREGKTNLIKMCIQAMSLEGRQARTQAGSKHAGRNAGMQAGG